MADFGHFQAKNYACEMGWTIFPIKMGYDGVVGGKKNQNFDDLFEIFDLENFFSDLTFGPPAQNFSKKIFFFPQILIEDSKRKKI